MKEQKPWGHYEVLEEGQNYKVKRIEVNPGQRLSLQSHKDRSEVWTIVQGVASAMVDGKDHLLPVKASLHIPVMALHRLENKGQETLIIIEVQTGSYLGEDDIIRYSDDYGRQDNANK